MQLQALQRQPALAAQLAVPPHAPLAVPAPKAPEQGVVLTLSQPTPRSGLYAADGLAVEDSGRIQMEKARMKEESAPCSTCAERSYQDGSDDLGVSFKSATSVSPAAAASAVIGHEREHESRAYDEGERTGADVQSSIRIHTSICPECKKVYVAGGVTETRISQPKQAMDAYNKQADALIGMMAI